MGVEAPRLVERWPVLAGQLRDALARDGEVGLAGQVEGLRVVELCRCGDDFCQSFYTELPSGRPYPRDRHRNWYPADDDPGWDGYLILDVVDERIVFVEVLNRSPLD